MQRLELDFSSQSKAYKAKQLNAQVCKNWYSINDETGKFKKPLIPFPGSLLWSNDHGLNHVVRGMYSLNGFLYGVVDDEFRIYNEHGEYKKIGTLNTSQGNIRFMANDNQIFITDFANGYVFQLVTTSSRNKDDFFRIENASSFIGDPTFTGSGLNDMSVSGTYTGTSDKDYRVEIDGQSQSSIGTPVFIGTGLNDLNASGTYTGILDKVFRVLIDGTGTPNTFKWSDDNGATWKASAVAITGLAQSLQEGVVIQFGATTGHILNDYWYFSANAAGKIDTFKWSDDGGNTWVATGIEITGADQTLNNGVLVVFLHTAGHAKNDYWDFSTTIDSAFYPPITPIYLDSYGIFPKSNTQRFYLSSSEDFSSINALDYANTNMFPDKIVCGVAINQEIIFIGQYTTEFWYDTGASPFPLQRRPNMLIHWGTSAPYSLAYASNSVLFWLGQSVNGGRVVVAMFNYDVQIISDKALNEVLESYDYVDDAIGFVIEWNGKIFYFLTLPSHDVTWVYDFDAKCWRQRTTIRPAQNVKGRDYVEGRYLANCHVFHAGRHYIGDWQSGKIYRLTDDYYMDGIMPIINEAITQPFRSTLTRLAAYSVLVDLESANALISGQGDNPTIMLQYSKDGGYTWSKERWRPIGKVGEYMRRVIWTKMGYSRNFVFRIRVSDPVYKVLLGAVMEFEDIGS